MATFQDCRAAVSRPLLGPSVVGNEVPYLLLRRPGVLLFIRCIQTLQENIRKLESIVHPLVAKHRQAFLQSVTEQRLVVLDIPLLYETKGENEVTTQPVAAIVKLAVLFVKAVITLKFDMCSIM